MPIELGFRFAGVTPETNDALPVRAVTRSLDALQRAVFHAAESLIGGEARLRGRLPRVVEQLAELQLRDVRSGSLSGCLVVVEPEARLFEEDDDLGDQAMQRVLDVVGVLGTDGAQRELRRVIPDVFYRNRILRDLEDTCPRRGENLVLSLLDADGSVKFVCNPEARELIVSHRLLPEEDVRNIIGDLVALRVAGQTHFTVRRHDREIRCNHGAELQTAVIELIGETVSVGGRAVVGPDGVIESMDEVYYVEGIDTGTRRIAQVESAGRHLRFTEPQHIQPEIEDDVVVLSLPALNLVSYGLTEEEAFDSLDEDIFFVWDEYGKEQPTEMTTDARELQEQARSILEEVSPGDGHSQDS